MPYVSVQIIKGAARAQKAQLVREMTDLLVHILKKKPEHTPIGIPHMGAAYYLSVKDADAAVQRALNQGGSPTGVSTGSIHQPPSLYPAVQGSSAVYIATMKDQPD